MSITLQRKQTLIQEFRRGDTDTGSVEVQVSILSEKISNLTQHFKMHVYDFASKRGLMMLIGKRRRLLNYLKSNDLTRYSELISRLGIRK